MTLTNNLSAKFVVGSVAVAMLFSVAFVPAQAATQSELEAQIAALQAQISAMGSGSTSGAGVCPFTWTRTLTQGTTGSDVMMLQKFLNSDAETRVSVSGAGSPGMETSTFGPATAAAVSKFQVKYRAEILTPLGLVNPTGTFGAATMAKANALCKGGTTGGGSTGGSTGGLSGGEASLEDFSANNGDDTDLEEGQEDGEVMEVEFDVEDGDAEIDRIDVAVDPGASNDEADPWDTFDEIAIMVDGKEVAREAADDEDDWEEDQPASGDYQFRFSGLDWVVEEGETANFVVAFSVQNGVDGTDDGEDWDVFIPTEGIRAIDGEGVNQYTGLTSDTVSFDIGEEGGDDELSVSASDEDPEGSTLVLESNSKSDWMTVFAFDLDTDDSTNDIEIRELPIGLTLGTSTGGYDDIISDVRIVVDGETYDDFSFQDSDNDDFAEVLVFDIDAGEFVIEAGEEVTVEVEVEFQQLDAGDEGVTVVASASSTNIEAEGADDLGASQLSGSATGETHTLRTGGIQVEFVSKSDTKSFSADAAGEKDIGEFQIVFTVTALEDDVYLDRTVTADPDRNGSGSAGSGFQWATTSDSTTGTGSNPISATVSAEDTDSDDTTTLFKVDEGDTREFTLTVNIESTNDGVAGVQLTGINWTNTAGSATAANFHTTGLSDFRTGLESLLII